jgi:hypothetical protein
MSWRNAFQIRLLDIFDIILLEIPHSTLLLLRQPGESHKSISDEDLSAALNLNNYTEV